MTEELESAFNDEIPHRHSRIYFMVARQPLSFRAQHPRGYINALKEAAQARMGPSLFSGRLYLRLIWLHSVDRAGNESDVDNISKPVHDALKGIVYKDDFLVSVRTASRIDIRQGVIIDSESFSSPIREVMSMIDKADQEEHLLYVEVGMLSGLQSVFSGPSDGDVQ